ncbi:hypothetical protein ACFYVL_40970 [Streptomyces sp. NPDC004111]|uniref:hypothetical protein n=1 Tax=Streptomyces sp. NPDC004111 TaxID=3364690 RepID=UPI0036AB49A1
MLLPVDILTKLIVHAPWTISAGRGRVASLMIDELEVQAGPLARRRVPGPDPGSVTESFEAGTHLVRSKNVKWLDPAGYARRVDVGLRGLNLHGREIDGWRGRNSQRDCAFVDGLYGTGLRLSEWASVLRLELPADDETRTYYTCRLAEACAKGGRGRRFWMPRSVLVDVLAYEEGERAAAVRRAQRACRYDRLPGVGLLQNGLCR